MPTSFEVVLTQPMLAQSAMSAADAVLLQRVTETLALVAVAFGAAKA